ncbi:helix-turn-helix domain-containing protein [bacterium]|nr:helix-turn-helix domain-containing protein [bacterium]
MPIGTTLTNLRRERGKTLADMESSTKIMGRMLSALENERWNELPASVYVKGYIQNYASALNVDPKPLLEEYAKDIAVVPHAEAAPLRRIPERTVVPHRLDVHQIPRKAWIAVAVAVLVVALLVWGLTALLGGDEEPPPIPPETTGTVEPDDTSSEAVTSGAQALPQGAFALSIEVAEGQSSWLQVTVDSLVAYEGTLPGGETKQWDVSDAAVIKVGKPAAVTITRDGQVVTVPPAEGIAEVTLVAADE